MDKNLRALRESFPAVEKTPDLRTFFLCDMFDVARCLLCTHPQRHRFVLLLQMFNCITELVLRAKKEVLAKQQQQQQNDVVKLTRNSKRKKKCC